MKLTNSGSVPVYTVSGSSLSRTLPDWLARQKKKSLKNDAEYQSRVEILQDFEFEEASICIRASEDGDWVMSTGTYKPQIHVHNLRQMSLSFARHTGALNHSFTFLSDDYSKSIHLQTDRRLELHTRMGCHYDVRIPRYGRAIVYDRNSTEALVPAVGLGPDEKGEVFRLNLELGRFMRSYQVDIGSDGTLSRGMQGTVDVGSVNTAAIAENTHNLLAFGTNLGTEFWDPRCRTRVAFLPSYDGHISALDFNPSGMSLITGSSWGHMQIFDLRRPVPILQKDQGYGFPIRKLIHVTTISQERKILSADKRIVKIWDEMTGEPWTSVEPEVDINDVIWCKNSGMILSANEGKQQHAWFVPKLGPAPKWCPFLDNIVEEMAEEVRTETYDNYKFLTKPELKSLSLSHLIGKTNLLRPYMHGYFVASKLYDQAKLIANPYMWEEERMKRVKAKAEEERASRIRGGKKVNINQRVVDKLLKKQENRAKVDTQVGLLGDDRFKKLFEDEEYLVDETSREFRALNPSTVVAPTAHDKSQDYQTPAKVATSIIGNEADGAASATLRPGAKKDGVVMRVSSAHSKGHPSRDTVLGSRIHKPEYSKRRNNGQVVGEQQMSFVPYSKEKKKMAFAPPPRKRLEGRRSASSNTLRRI